jgi:hypothetical protein
MIRDSTNQLEQRLQQAARNTEFTREEALLSQESITHEQYTNI